MLELKGLYRPRIAEALAPDASATNSGKIPRPCADRILSLLQVATDAADKPGRPTVEDMDDVMRALDEIFLYVNKERA